MAQFPGLMLWTDAWVADTHHLSRDVRGAYMDLLIKMWRTPGCRVPNDDAWLARQLCMTVDEVVEILRPIIKEFCQTDGNWVFQKRLQREFVRAFQTQVGRRDRAKYGWKKRKRSAHAMHPDQNRKRESLQYRAREEAEPEEAAEKKTSKQVSAELYHLVAAKRAASEE
jgi:uncharacterized protein YdaU (DUF1376 family)